MGFARALRDPQMRGVYEAWCRLRSKGEVLRAELDPTVLPRSALPYLFLYVRTASSRFYCSLAGTGISNRVGYDPTGKYLDQMLRGGALKNRTELFEQPLATGMPLFYRAFLAVQDRDHVRSERLLLPMIDRDGTRSVLFGHVRFETLTLAERERIPLGDVADPELVVVATEADLAPPIERAAG